MRNLSALVGSGLLTAGVSAAVLVGAGVAAAQTDPGPDPAPDSTSAPAAKSTPEVKPDDPKPGDSKAEDPNPSNAEPAEDDPASDDPASDDPAPADGATADVKPSAEPESEAAEPELLEVTAEPEADEVTATAHTRGGVITPREPVDQPAASDQVETSARADDVTVPDERTDIASATPATAAAAPATVEPALQERAAEDTVSAEAFSEPAAEPADKSGAVTALRMVSAAEATPDAVSPPQTTIIGFLTSILFGLLTTLEQIVTGPPALPAGSTVSVRSSSLQINDTMTVAADWYFPDGDDPPQRMILLQHGFLAIGPMYSYTAARLAEETHSIVVAPTLNSNFLADGGLWLGGNQMHEAVAALFTGDRAALTASAVAAGYAERYHLDPATAALPTKFGLTGHSLGGALVSGVAGYLAADDAAGDLVGVVLLDGVPTGDQLTVALANLADYEDRTDDYVPVRAIGAPLNLFNIFGNTNEALAQARPDRFNGVVLTGGVHMDAMQGGNALIQFAAYLIAGFPQAQNPPAVEELSVAWFEDWFDGYTDIGDDLVPGSTITIATPAGPATGTVIGTAPALAATTRESAFAAV